MEDEDDKEFHGKDKQNSRCICRNRKKIITIVVLLVAACILFYAGYYFGACQDASVPIARQTFATEKSGIPNEISNDAAASTDSFDGAAGIETYDTSDDYNAYTQEEKGSKKHYSIYVNIQTTDYDKTLSELNSLLTKYDADIINSSESDSNSTWYTTDSIGTRGMQYADIEARIPANTYKDMMDGLNGISGKIVSKNISCIDNTRQYNNNNDRLTALQLEKKQIEKLMEQAMDSESLIALYQHLTDINTEIAGLTTNQNDIQYDADYTELNIHVETVAQYDNATKVNASFGERFIAGLRDGWRGLINFIQGLILYLAIHWYMVVIIAFVVVYFISRRKKKAKKCTGCETDTKENNTHEAKATEKETDTEKDTEKMPESQTEKTE